MQAHKIIIKAIRLTLLLVLLLAFALPVSLRNWFEPKVSAATTFTVTNTNDSGSGSLRQAILNANASPGADAIVFSIGSGAQTIKIGSAPLPAVTDPVIIDGTTQPGFSGKPIVELNGFSATNSDQGGYVDGLSLVAGDSTVRGLVINRFATGGILIEGKGGNTIQGNYIGPAMDGTTRLGYSSTGINIYSSNNLIGGTTPEARNVISGHNGLGINVFGKNVTGNRIQGNYIGTNADGSAVIGNNSSGISIGDSPGNIIGGAEPGARNVISGNSSGGIGISSSGAVGNQIQGNYIGVNAAGNAALRNGGFGINIQTANNIIGGATPETRNIISGNTGSGVNVSGVYNEPPPDGNIISGNYIGTDASGTVAIGNTGIAVAISGSNNIIGGTVAGAGNLISGNNSIGILVSGNGVASTAGIKIQGNYIGTQADGVSPLGNNSCGIATGGIAANTIIGGTVEKGGNVIAFNQKGGVCIGDSGPMFPHDGNAVRANSIFSNNGLGIDLSSDSLNPDGVTLNDSGDSDIGANQRQNFPVLSSTFASGSNLIINGALNSIANSSFALDFYANNACDPSGYGEGQQYIGSATAATDASGNATLSLSFPLTVPTGYFITATATDAKNNTSEFSQCVQVTGAAPTPTPSPTPIPPESYAVSFLNSSYTVSEGAGSATIRVDRHNVNATTPSGAATVDYATGDGTANQKRDYTAASGTLQFAPGEFVKTFTIPIIDNGYRDGNRTVNLTLSNAVGVLLHNPKQAVLTITDNDNTPSPPPGNPIDEAQFFVRQHYYDFLNRLPDDGGLNYWTSQITNCNGDPQCLNSRRVSVSAAFFIEQEFQKTGSYVYRMYTASYGQRPSYAQFIPDRARINPDAAQIEASKQQFADLFVQRPEFLKAYPATMPAGDFIDQLIATVKTETSGIVDLSSQQANLLYILQTNGRGSAVRQVAEDTAFQNAEFNNAFVLMQYFGYLRRDPDDAGYKFWLDVLNNKVQNNYRGMVCAFVTSAEYQDRFSSVKTRNDSVCGSIGP